MTKEKNNQTITIISSEKKVVYFITDEIETKKDGEVTNCEKPLNSLFKQLLLNDDFRENFFKRSGKMALLPSFITLDSRPRSAQAILNEVCGYESF